MTPPEFDFSLRSEINVSSVRVRQDRWGRADWSCNSGYRRQFYGTTSEGGTSGLGVVFKLTSAGVLTVLHDFNGTDGQTPDAGLVQANDGNFYGVASAGGTLGHGTFSKSLRRARSRLCTTLTTPTEQLQKSPYSSTRVGFCTATRTSVTATGPAFS